MSQGKFRIPIQIKITILVDNGTTFTAAEDPVNVRLVVNNDFTVADGNPGFAYAAIIVCQNIGIAIAAGVDDQVLGVGVHAVKIQHILIGSRSRDSLYAGYGGNDLHPALIGSSHIISDLSFHANPGANIAVILCLTQGNGLRRLIDSCVIGQFQRISGSLVSADIPAIAALRLQVVQTIGAITLHSDLIVFDLEHGHGQLVSTLSGNIVPVVVVADITCIHVGKFQGFFGPIGGTALLSDIDLFAHRQVDGLTAQVVVIAVGMVMAVHEDDVQSLAGSVAWTVLSPPWQKFFYTKITYPPP